MVDRTKQRRFRDLLETLAGAVYFAPQVHAAFEGLGFGPSGGTFNGVAGPNRNAYFVSRAACMGRVNGHTVTMAFGVFSPEMVVPAVEAGWAIAEPQPILDARLDGITEFVAAVNPLDAAETAELTDLLERAGAAGHLAGRPLFAGLCGLDPVDDPSGRLFRAADVVREHRGDCHIAAWTGAGLTAPQIMLLTEHWWGIPRRSYSLTRGWNEFEFDMANNELAAKGLVDGDELLPAGRELRRAIERTTDELELEVIEALGDLDRAIELLEPLSRAIVANAGYPATAFQTADDAV